jgi:hypothetical protein
VNELTTYQQDQYNDIKANSAFDGVTVVGPAMGQPQNQTALPNMSGMVDTGNDHPYPGTGDVGYSTLDDYLTDSQVTWPTLPLVITEDGYETNPNSGDGDAVTQAYQGIMEPHIPLENFRRGVSRTFLYSLVDDGTSTDTNGSHHFGLIQNNGSTFTAKPAYTSIQNLISILSDAGSRFTCGALGFNLSGSTNDVHTLLLQKRNGRYYLAIWLESTNTTATQSVTVSFDDWMNSSASLYYPCTSSSATAATLTNNAITLSISAQPTILSVSPNAPNGSLIIDTLSNLNDTSSSLNWTTLAASPTNWLGRTTEAERTAANGNNDLIYSSVDIRNFTALVGFGWNTTNPDGVTYAFSKLQLFASPDGTNWTSVPSYVGEIDKAAASAAQASARWLVPVSPSGPLPTGTNYIKFVVNSTDSVGLPQLFQMNIRQSGVLEAESMSVSSSGATTTVVNDSNASNGQYVQLNATATGQYMKFTTPTLPPGTYNVWLRYCRQPNNGIVGFMVDSTNMAGAGENGTAGQYAEANRGSVTFTTAGTHTLTFTVVGTATTGYAVNADRVVFQQTSP